MSFLGYISVLTSNIKHETCCLQKQQIFHLNNLCETDRKWHLTKFIDRFAWRNMHCINKNCIKTCFFSSISKDWVDSPNNILLNVYFTLFYLILILIHFYYYSITGTLLIFWQYCIPKKKKNHVSHKKRKGSIQNLKVFCQMLYKEPFRGSIMWSL